LEIVVGIYKLLNLDFSRYSQRWKLTSLIQFINEEQTSVKSSNKNVDQTKQNEELEYSKENNKLCKWFTLEIFSLLFTLTPAQKEKYFQIYFSKSEIDDLNFK
jgi:hypothetical protein